VGSRGFGFGFGHVLAVFGAAVVAVAGAVVDAGGEVEPDFVGGGSWSLLGGGLEGLLFGCLGGEGENDGAASKGERCVQRPKLHADVSCGMFRGRPDVVMVAGDGGGRSKKQVLPLR
jgi:hypothetical protein